MNEREEKDLSFYLSGFTSRGASGIVNEIGFAFSFLVGYGRCQRQGLRQKRENKAKTN